jgi:hypothetical protein
LDQLFGRHGYSSSSSSSSSLSRKRDGYDDSDGTDGSDDSDDDSGYEQIRLPDGTLGILFKPSKKYLAREKQRKSKKIPLSYFLNKEFKEDKADEEFGERTLGGSRWCSSKGEYFYVKLEYVYDDDETNPFEEERNVKLNTRYDTIGLLIRRAVKYLNEDIRMYDNVTMKDIEIETEDDTSSLQKFNYVSDQNKKLCSVVKKNSIVKIIVPSEFRIKGGKKSFKNF